MRRKGIRLIPGLLAFYIILHSCSSPLKWAESPLYVFEKSLSDTSLFTDREKVLNEITGHYAHYDVVAYEDTTTRTTWSGSPAYAI